MNTLQTFVVAAQKLNFSQAGQELNVSHAAVSKQMKRLEEWFGRKLFARSGRGIVLTAAGQELVRVSDGALLAISTISQKIQIDKKRKQISVACLPSIATCWLVPYLSDFMQQHPALAIELSYARAFQTFDAECHDVLITQLDNLPANSDSNRIFNRTSKPVASAAYVKSRKLDLAGGLEGARLLHDASVVAWEDWFREAGFRPSNYTNGPIYPDFNLLFTAIMAGQGVALCPIEVFQQEIERGELVVLSDIVTMTGEGYYVVTKEEPILSVRTFVRWFRSKVASAR